MRGRRSLVVVMAVVLLGGHWGALQVVAWGGMLVTQAQRAPWREVVERTFAGHHPCDLCVAIASGRDREKQPDAPAPFAKKAEVAVLTAVWALPPAAPQLMVWPSAVAVAASRRDAPPVPPPRG